MNRVSKKVALITGGNAGIGEAVAKTLAREGAAVVITGRREHELERVVQDIRREHGHALAVTGSVTDEQHARAAVEQTVRQFGSLDILVNNAGIGDFGRRLHEMDDSTWQQVMEINVTGVFRMTRAAVPQMLKQQSGSIVNISSIASLVGLPLLPAYAASKGALDALTRAIAIDYAKEGIRCNVVNPGLTATPMAAPLLTNPDQLEAILKDYPIKRMGTPEEIAHLVLFLASDEAAWVTGASYTIDGGKTAW